MDGKGEGVKKSCTITIDGRAVEIRPGQTVFQACVAQGVEIPHFCYHERLSIAGNCRMCLVEMEGSPKPIASCAMPVMDKMVIRTDTPMVREARRGVLEFLLINHPLDCPICDQGGECDLQDLAMHYGQFESRFHENKRSVAEKDFGPLIKTEMTRCIHCTRCIRFATEVAGVEDLGATGRGGDMEVGTYVKKALRSEMSGNMIDLCPVGALNSKPYSLTARAWEMTKTQTIDVMDAVGSHIRVDSFGSQVMRVLPRLRDDINEEWISDKSRFSYDALGLQRLDRPWLRVDGRLVPVSWQKAFEVGAEKLRQSRPGRIAAIAGDMCCLESMQALKDLMRGLGSPHTDCRQDGAALDAGVRASYLFNSTIAGIEDADACLLIGTNPRWEAALINARLLKRSKMGGFAAAGVGPVWDLGWPVDALGTDAGILEAIADGRHSFAKVLKKAKRAMLIIGMAALTRPDGAAIMRLAGRIAANSAMIVDGWNGFNVLHTAAARVGGLDIGFLPGPGGFDTAAIVAGAGKGDLDVLWLLGADELIDAEGRPHDFGRTFVIYQGHHGDRGAAGADLVLPGAAYTEKNATYVNTEGRYQEATRAIMPPGMARDDWLIIRTLAEKIKNENVVKSMPYKDILKLRMNIQEPSRGSDDDGSWLASIGDDGSLLYDQMGLQDQSGRHDQPGRGAVPATGRQWPAAVPDFYLSDAISRSSPTMAKCARAFYADLDGSYSVASAGSKTAAPKKGMP